MFLEKNFYIYRHIRLDTNEVFYIGMGKNPKYYKSFEKEFQRAYHKEGRSSFWQNIINKTKYEIEIILTDLTKEEAINKEIELIKLYGRRNLNKGTLVNLTDGGEGGGVIVSAETRVKLSIAGKGRKLPRGKDSHSFGKRGLLHGFYGKHHTSESLIKIKEERKIRKIKTGFSSPSQKFDKNKIIEIQSLFLNSKYKITPFSKILAKKYSVHYQTIVRAVNFKFN